MRLAVRSEDGKCIVDSGASIRVIGYSSQTPKERMSIRDTDSVREIQTANGLVESRTEAKVVI